MNKKGLATLLDVSPSAVSIAMNGRKGISDKTRHRILQAAEQYGMKSSPQKPTVSDNISFIVFKKHGQVYGDTPFFSSVAEGISAGITEAGYKMQMSFIYASQDPEAQLDALDESDCAGIIMLATEMDCSDIELCNRIKKPVVILDSYYEGCTRDCVVINNRQGMFLATKHVIECGHTQLGYIHSSVHINNFDERYEGFRHALRQAGLEEADVRISVGSTSETAYNDMNRYLDMGGRLPAALVADNDIIALSCIRAMKEHGYSLPEDVSIVGFDDMPAAFVSAPKLTTINVPKQRIGIEAVRLLMRRIAEEDPDMTDCIRIGVQLVVRDSVLHVREEQN